DELLGEIEHQPQAPIVEIEVELGGVLRLDPFLAPAPKLRSERGRDVLGETQRLADLAHRTARAIADHGRAERRPLAAIGLVDPLDHLLAPLMFEIDIDIGRLLAVRADEALEEEIAFLRIDRGDAEHEAHGGVSGGAPALAENLLRAREADDRIDGEEVRRVA